MRQPTTITTENGKEIDAPMSRQTAVAILASYLVDSLETSRPTGDIDEFVEAEVELFTAALAELGVDDTETEDALPFTETQALAAKLKAKKE